MTAPALAALLAFSLSAPALAAPALEQLKAQAAKDPGAAARAEQAKSESGEPFHGPVAGINIQVLGPVALVGAPAARRSSPPPAPRDAPSGPRSGYHFEGRSPFSGLTLYSPVKDAPSGRNETRSTGGGGFLGFLKSMLKWVPVVLAVIAAAVLLL